MIASAQNLDELDAHALREKVRGLMAALGEKEQTLAEHQRLLATRREEIRYKDTKIAQLTHEIAGLRRYRFGKSGEQFSGAQGSLLEETVDADIAAIEAELEVLRGRPAARPVQQPKRAALPDHLPRVEHRHEPQNTTCQCGCQLQRIGEDVAEKLDYTPGLFDPASFPRTARRW
ncbi:hypothetical protein H0A66_18250 [Alcaligenaceae bacterium]|nr:hypothetical protein [Alcaligenaceae bacterium]